MEQTEEREIMEEKIAFDPEKRQKEIAVGAKRLQTATGLNWGLLLFLVACSVYAVWVFLNRARFGPMLAGMPQTKMVLVIIAHFAVLWVVYYGCKSIQRKLLRGQRLPKEEFGKQIKVLSTVSVIQTVLVTLLHVLLLFFLGTMPR